MSPRAWAVAGGVVSMILAVLAFDPYLFTGGDNIGYYALTRALATGRGYVDLITPGTPTQSQYPPGFPLLLVPFYWLFGGNYVALKLESLLAGAVALFALWKLARRDPAVPEWAAVAAVWLFGLYPVFRIYTHWVLSDMSYVSLSLVALAMYARATWEEGKPPPETAQPSSSKRKPRKGSQGSKPKESPALERSGDRPGGWWLAATLVALFGFYVRTAGIPLLLAPLAWALWHRSWRRAGVVAAVLLLGASPWFLWARAQPPETGGYMQQVSAVNRLDPTSASISSDSYISRGWDNLVHYAKNDFPQMFTPLVVPPAIGKWRQPPPAVQAFTIILGGALLAFGIYRALRTRGLAIWDLHALLATGIMLVWAWTGDRFFLTVAPLLWLYILVGLDAASRLVTGSVRVAQIAAAGVAAVLMAGAIRDLPTQLRLTRAWLGGDDLAGYSAFWQDYFEAAKWVGENAPDAVIVARKPTFAWFWSGGRPSFVFPFHRDPDRTWESFRRKGATHLILEDNSRLFLATTLEPHMDQLELVHSSPRRIVIVVRMQPD